jgi:hypothetical protein
MWTYSNIKPAGYTMDRLDLVCSLPYWEENVKTVELWYTVVYHKPDFQTLISFNTYINSDTQRTNLQYIPVLYGREARAVGLMTRFVSSEMHLILTIKEIK